jgi:hypothetical protein
MLIACHSNKSVVSSEQFDVRRLQTMAINLVDTTLMLPVNIFNDIPSTSAPMGSNVPRILTGSKGNQSCLAGAQPAVIIRHAQLSAETRDKSQGVTQQKSQEEKAQLAPDDSFETFLVIIVFILVMHLVFMKLRK